MIGRGIYLARLAQSESDRRLRFFDKGVHNDQ
jgi:hypothetical protein